MKVFCKEFITVWTRGLVRWLSRKFDSISIDLTPVAKQGTNPDATNTAILAAFGNIDFSTLAHETSVKDGNDTAIGMLKDQTNGLAAIKTAIGNVTVDTSNLATKNLEQFFNITGATSYTAASTVEILNELVSIWENVFDAHPAEVSIEGTHIVRYVDGHHMYEIPIPDENTLG